MFFHAWCFWVVSVVQLVAPAWEILNAALDFGWNESSRGASRNVVGIIEANRVHMRGSSRTAGSFAPADHCDQNLANDDQSRRFARRLVRSEALRIGRSSSIRHSRCPFLTKATKQPVLWEHPKAVSSSSIQRRGTRAAEYSSSRQFGAADTKLCSSYNGFSRGTRGTHCSFAPAHTLRLRNRPRAEESPLDPPRSPPRGGSLNKVHPSKDDAKTDIDIIAVHGLDTKSPDTWTWVDRSNPKNKVNWLQDPKMLLEQG